MTERTTEWWWIRHAPVPGAPAKIFGQLDAACDTSDAAAFAAIATRLPTDAVWIISSLRRTRQTADALVAAGAASSEPIVEPDLAEQNFGRWQGMSWDQMRADDPDAYRVFWRDPTGNAPPGGESYAQHMERVAAAVTRWSKELVGRHIVCVSHGGSIRAAVAMALGLTPPAAMALVIDNLSLTRLDHVPDGLLRGRGRVWSVRGVNLPCRWIPSPSAC